MFKVLLNEFNSRHKSRVASGLLSSTKLRLIQFAALRKIMYIHFRLIFYDSVGEWLIYLSLVIDHGSNYGKNSWYLVSSKFLSSLLGFFFVIGLMCGENLNGFKY